MQLQPSVVKWGRRIMWLAVLATVGTAGWYLVVRGKPAAGSPSAGQSAGETLGAPISVEVATPRPGGIDRVCHQPGSVEPFESAELYTKVSGFLIEQKVDIGDTVRVGDVLARIAVPEYEKQVKQDAADVERARARVDQMTAAIATAEADLGAATAAVSLAEAEKKSKASYRAYREKQRERIRDLVARDAIDAKLADEQEDQYQASVAAESAASEAISASKQKELAARARVKQAQADLRYAEAEVATTKARLEKSQVMVDYAVIQSPYTGVVTKRNFHVGDFVRSADAGGDRIPVLVVERTDLMRVIVQVPERDVPFVGRGNSAMVEVDALPGVVFKTRGELKVEVSRTAASEDPHTRMMRTEVHVNNPDGKLRRGMFGRVTLVLQPGTPGSLRIPSAALVGKADGVKGSVRVVRNDKAFLVPVQYGADNGSEVEVISGLTAADQVIIRASGPIDEAATIAISSAQALRVATH